MALQRAHAGTSVYVLCCGVPFGNGEELFFDFFRRSWLSLHPGLATLPVLEKGENLVPTIHARDVALSIKFVAQARPKQQYMVAVADGEAKLG